MPRKISMRADFVARRKTALKNLESQHEKFKNAKVDKVTKQGIITPFDRELARMNREIDTLKKRIT